MAEAATRARDTLAFFKIVTADVERAEAFFTGAFAMARTNQVEGPTFREIMLTAPGGGFLESLPPGSPNRYERGGDYAVHPSGRVCGGMRPSTAGAGGRAGAWDGGAWDGWSRETSSTSSSSVSSSGMLSASSSSS